MRLPKDGWHGITCKSKGLRMKSHGCKSSLKISPAEKTWSRQKPTCAHHAQL